MMAKSHVVVGVICFGVYDVVVNGGITFSRPDLYAISIFGSLLPDIDHPGSWLGSKLKLISYPILLVFGHRGITHSLIIVGFLSAFLWLSLEHLSFGQYIVPLIVGYLSHLLGDFVANSGVPLFYPNRKRYRFIITFNTGGVAEHVILTIMILFIAWVFINMPVKII